MISVFIQTKAEVSWVKRARTKFFPELLNKPLDFYVRSSNKVLSSTKSFTKIVEKGKNSKSVCYLFQKED